MAISPAAFRGRAPALLDAGRSLGEVADPLDVGTATLKRWRRQRRETGSRAPGTSPGRRPRIGPCRHAALRAQVRAHPDATLAEHCDLWATTTGDRVSPATMCRTLQRLDLTLKKKRLTATERDPEARAAWWDEAAWLAPADLAFVAEASPHTALTRLRARAPRGEPAVGTAPRNHGPNVALLAALTPDGIGPSPVVTGAGARPVFEAFVAEFLVPSLRPGQVVTWDNLSGHKGERARALVEAAGCHLRFLPPYSPDFNPSEPAFAALKADLRRAEARTEAAPLPAIGDGLPAVTPADARACFAHCGYPLPDHPFRNRV